LTQAYGSTPCGKTLADKDLGLSGRRCGDFEIQGILCRMIDGTPKVGAISAAAGIPVQTPKAQVHS
jgi:hypothetical protein